MRLYNRLKRSGFTLIELMVVVSIIGILASIAVPKFADMVLKSKEGATKGSLGSIRSALGIYYGDLEGMYPTDPSQLTVNGKYLTAVPIANTPPYHTATTAIKDCNGLANCVDDWAAAGLPPTAHGWAYDMASGDSNFGTLWVNCSHTDTKGTIWSNY